MTRITFYTWRHKLKTCKCFTCFAWFGVWNNPAYFWTAAPFNSSPVSVPPTLQGRLWETFDSRGGLLWPQLCHSDDHTRDLCSHRNLCIRWPHETLAMFHDYTSLWKCTYGVCMCFVFWSIYEQQENKETWNSLKDVKWRGNVSSKRSYTVKWSRFKCCKLREWNLNPNYKTKYQSSLSQSQKTHLFVLCVKTCKASLKYGHLPRFK